MFKKILFLASLILFPFFLSAETDWVKEAEKVDISMNDVEIIVEDDSSIIRLLSWKHGYEHITTKIVIQKFLIGRDNPEVPYKLERSVYIDEFDPEYTMYFSSVSEEGGKFHIHMKGFHAYMYTDAEAVITMDRDLEYTVEIECGMPE